MIVSNRSFPSNVGLLTIMVWTMKIAVNWQIILSPKAGVKQATMDPRTSPESWKSVNNVPYNATNVDHGMAMMQKVQIMKSIIVSDKGGLDLK